MSHSVCLSTHNSIDEHSDATWRINNFPVSCKTGSFSMLTKDLEPFSVHYKLDKILMIDMDLEPVSVHYKLDKILMIDNDLEPVSVHYKLDKILMIDKLNSETNQRIYTQQTINAFQVKENFFFDMQEFLPIFQGSKFGSNNHDTVLIEGVWTCVLRGAAVTNNNIMNLTHTTSEYPPISS